MKRNFYTAVFIPVLSLLLFWSINAFAEEAYAAPIPVTLSPDSEKVSISGLMETLEDPSGKLTFDEVTSPHITKKFKSVTDSIPNYGFTDSTFWTRFAVKNSSLQSNRWILEIAFPLLDDVEIFIENPGATQKKWSHYRQGRQHPFDERIIYHRNILYPVTIAAGNTRTIYLKIRTGDGMIFPVTFWQDGALARKLQHEQYYFGIYYGIIIVMVLYNLFIFASVRDRNYLYYVLYIAAFGLFQMAMNGLAFQYLWPGFPWWGIHANPFLIGLSVLFAVNFSINFLKTEEYTPRLHRFLQGIMFFSGTLAVASFLVPYRLSITVGQLLPLAAVLSVIPAATISYRSGHQAARFYLLAWSSFLLGIILSTLRVMGFIPHHFLTEYGMQIGSGLEMVLLSFALADSINIANTEKKKAQEKVIKAQKEMVESLQKSKAEIEEARRIISLSEKKYRLLVEGSSDIIFSLDEGFNFINASEAMHRIFKIKQDQVVNLNLLDLIYEEDVKNNVSRRIVKKKLRDFSRDRGTLTFKAHFYSQASPSPREMRVQLEYINIEGKNEILGKFTSITEDVLLNFFQEEKQRYAITNYLANAEEITQRLTRNLKKYLSTQDITFLRIALREIVINAIEHGNLEITFEEKSQAIEEDNYFTFVNERQLTPELKDRKVHIEHSLNKERVVFIITDEGKGFNHRDAINSSAENANIGMLPHGRGIAMACNVFDRISYNDRGNQVMLIKYFARKTAPQKKKILA